MLKPLFSPNNDQLSINPFKMGNTMVLQPYYASSCIKIDFNPFKLGFFSRVAFFLGHPVYIYIYISRQSESNGDINDFGIIGRAKNNFFLGINESLFIKKFKPDLNNKVISFPMLLFDLYLPCCRFV